MLCVALSAPADVPATLLDAELNEQPIRLRSLSETGVSYFDADRNLQSMPLDRVLRLRFEREPAVPVVSDRGRTLTVLTVDGQQWVGFLADDQEADRLGVYDANVGPLTASAEDIQNFRLDTPEQTLQQHQASHPIALPELQPGTRPTEPMPDDDVVELVNGERLVGFLEGFSDAGVSVETNIGPIVDAAWSQVHQVRLANPRRVVVQRARDDAPVLRVRATHAGQYLLIDPDLSTADPAQLVTRLGPQGSVSTLPLDRIREIEPLTEVQVVDLLDLPAAAVPTDLWGTQVTASVDRTGWHLHAPTRLRVSLPEGAQRAQVRLALSAADAVPEALRPLLGVTVRPAAMDQPPADDAPSVTLTADEPAGLLRLDELPEGSIDLVFTPGDLGPVLARVTVTGGEVVVRRAADGDPRNPGRAAD
jgi:hypothetical protein